MLIPTRSSTDMPASYEDNVFLDCDSDLQEVVGTYVGSNGATSTWSQPSSLPADSTLPWTPTIPATSNCKTYASTDIFPTSLLGYQVRLSSFTVLSRTLKLIVFAPQTSASASSSSATATSTDSKASKSTAASRSGNSASAAAQSGGAGSQGSSSTTKNGAVAVGVSGILAVASVVVTLLF